MVCPKCGSRNVHLTGASGDTAGRIIHYLSCSECNHSWDTAKEAAQFPNTTTKPPKVAELPDELEINGIKYRRVEK